MKKYFLPVIILALAIFCVGCGSDKTDSDTETTKGEEKAVENNITYEDGDSIVTDSSVFGDNVYVFSADDEIKYVQSKVDEIYGIQESNQFGDERYALLFMPGEYDESLSVNVGFYTQVLGLGIMPTNTNINTLWVNADWMSHNATCNFWRSAENMSVDEYCMWANSQAVSLRRMNFNDELLFSDGEGWSSGGFMADCKVKGTVYSGSQQQYLCRNDDWEYWDGGVWNMVFVGVNRNRIPNGGWPSMPYTKIDETPKVCEKPYLCYDDEHGYGVMVPSMQTDTSGVSWDEGVEGKFVGLDLFYIANPMTDTAGTINEAIANGKNILLTPGIYHVDEPIVADVENTIIYGMGLATIVADNGCCCMEIGDVDGVKVCGILFEAGEKRSDNLLLIGKDNAKADHAANPICLSDVYFRVGGGEYAGKVKSCVTINANDVIGDNFWVWRADHSKNVGWDVNTAPNGITINGDNVTMYGLFVEHFQEYQTVWNGNGGQLYFYQSEMPYDAPNQESYMSHDGSVDGYASLKVDDEVNDFSGYGIGVYCYNRDAEVNIETAVEVPDCKGVALCDVVTVKLNGKGGISHVVNNDGNSLEKSGDIARIIEYENGMVQ